MPQSIEQAQAVSNDLMPRRMSKKATTVPKRTGPEGRVGARSMVVTGQVDWTALGLPAVFRSLKSKDLRPLQGITSPLSQDSLTQCENALDIEEEWDYYRCATLHSAVYPIRAGRTIPVNLRHDSLIDLHNSRDGFSGSLRG
jgi:hypothetical protein